MGILTDVLAGLPINAVQRQKLEDQEKRLLELEQESKLLKERLARYEAEGGEKCPSCRRPIFELKENSPSPIFPGLSDYKFSCVGCGFEETVEAASAAEAWRLARVS